MMAPDRSPGKMPPRSLEDVHSSVPIPRARWRRLLAFAGPAFLISVGYMDPGNWGTDIEAGSRFGYQLLWVLLLSNVMAVLLQSLASRLGIVTGRDLAQACHESYPRTAVWGLWILCELAIAATDLAEVIGTVIALKMFGLDYGWGLLVAACDTFLLLALQRHGVRMLEVLTLLLIAVIAGSFFVEIVLARPDWTAALSGFVPRLSPEHFQQSLYVAIAMLGATVMPHNLYLHSALVQTRAFRQTGAGKTEACKYNLIDSAVALNGAFLVNAAILLMAATAFFPNPVRTLPQARELLQQTWRGLAGWLFAVALLASGQSSTMTGTLAGQVVMEGFVHLRLRPWVRRLLTRALALIPAVVVIGLSSRQPAAPAGTETVSLVDERLLWLLVLSQAILSFQLPFAIIPLLQFTGDRRRMGEFVNRPWLKTLAWSCAAGVVVLNGILIALSIRSWAEDLTQGGGNPWWIYGTAGPVAGLLAAFLGWLMVYPAWARRPEVVPAAAAPALPAIAYGRIGVALELTENDGAVLAQAAALARLYGAELTLVHVVDGPGGSFLGANADDQESRNDRTQISELVAHLQQKHLTVQGVLGYGRPPEELVRIAREQKFDLLVMGSHGHRFLADMALGETVAPVLHRLTIPILVIPTRRTT